MLKTNPYFKFFASLKLAVFCLLSLSAILAVATVFESLYGMRGAHLLVYGTFWFYGVLFLLGLNVFCAAAIRYPWKKNQTGFVITHTGIIILLVGSAITKIWGVDGNLPVMEGSQSGEVLLEGTHLVLAAEGRKTKQSFAVPETALKAEGDILNIELPRGERLVVKEFLPRSVMERRIADSPNSALGVPALRVELFNDRFDVANWLMLQNPDTPESLSLGPATLTLGKAWTLSQWKEFERPGVTVTAPSAKLGTLVVERGGGQFRVDVALAVKNWQSIGTTGLELKVDRYLPYAMVEKNELVNKSQEPVNPAVQLRIRDVAGFEEKHTIFANFPEFATLHRQGTKRPQTPFGMKILMEPPVRATARAQNPMMAAKGRLEFLQSPDDKALRYRVFNSEGKRTHFGEVRVGTDYPTGWMNLKFRVREWFPRATDSWEPRYVEQVAGSQGNFNIALRVEHEEKASGYRNVFWLSENQTQPILVDGDRVNVSLERKTMDLPFAIQLEKFRVGNDPGTNKAATYQSMVMVRDPATPKGLGPFVVQMNEPLEHGGYTFYQASYQLEEGKPAISVFSVNRDPGRFWKYLGSLLVVLGSAVMFYMNPQYWGKIFGWVGVKDKGKA